MAGKPRRNNSELKEEIERSRTRVAREVRGLRYELDFPRKIRRSFRRQPVPWIAAATAVGLVLAFGRLRKKKVYVDAGSGRKSKSKLLEAGFLLGALKIAATVLKPVIVPFLQRKVSEFSGSARRGRKWRV